MDEDTPKFGGATASDRSQEGATAPTTPEPAGSCNPGTAWHASTPFSSSSRSRHGPILPGGLIMMMDRRRNTRLSIGQRTVTALRRVTASSLRRSMKR